MKIENRTNYELTAFGWSIEHGFGKMTSIPSGESADIDGPYLGETGDGSCHIDIPGEIICHEKPDEEKKFQVFLGKELALKITHDLGVTVLHRDDEKRIIAQLAATNRCSAAVIANKFHLQWIFRPTP